MPDQKNPGWLTFEISFEFEVNFLMIKQTPRYLLCVAFMEKY